MWTEEVQALKLLSLPNEIRDFKFDHNSECNLTDFIRWLTFATWLRTLRNRPASFTSLQCYTEPMNYKLPLSFIAFRFTLGTIFRGSVVVTGAMKCWPINGMGEFGSLEYPIYEPPSDPAFAS